MKPYYDDPDVSEYAPGSERLERLYEAMETAQRFQHPDHFTFNP